MSLYAQTGIHGVITDVGGKSMPNVNVLLLLAKDSSLVRGIVTSNDGKYIFENIPAGSYIIRSSFAGYQNEYTVPISYQREQIDMGPLKMTPLSGELHGVTVTAKKPLFEQTIDRMVINVQNSITSAGGTALEILEKSPGVIVDHQNNTISIGGKSGVVVMINGKTSHMPSSAIVQLLNGMNASNIEKIEVITSPPASFDAEGNAGFINVVLKSNPDLGTNGSFSLTMGYGTGTTPAGNINVNHRKGKVNLFGDYSFLRRHMIQNAYFYRSVRNQGVTTENFVHSRRDAVQRNHNIRIGLDYQLSPKTVVGALVGSYDNKWSMNALNKSKSIVNGSLDSSVTIKNDEINQWRHFLGNINFQHIGAKKDRVSFDADYVFYRDNNPTNYTNTFFNSTGVYAYENQTKSGKVTPIKVFVAKLDYSRKIGSKTDMESGVKTSFSNFTNDVLIERFNQGHWTTDASLSAMYRLKEKIAAAYAIITMTMSPKTTMKAGIRYEHTISNLGARDQPDIIDRSYGNFFPSLFVTTRLNNNNAATFSYLRRITRPTFNDMAPFIIFFDPSTYFSGNTGLQPSTANTVKMVYTYRKYFLSAEYSFEKNAIVRFTPSVDSVTNKLTVKSENIINSKTFSTILSLPVTVNSWWNMQLTVMGLWQQFNAIFNKMPVRIEQKFIRLNYSQNFILPKEFTLQASGFYQSAGFGIFGLAVLKPYGSVDFGIRKKFDHERGSLSFTVTNTFNTDLWDTYVHLPEQNLVSEVSIQFFMRTFRLTYTRSFGNKALKGSRARGTGSEEERRRVTN